MSIRAAILFCCIAGAAYAQEPSDHPPDPVSSPQSSDSPAVNKPTADQQKPATPRDGQKAAHANQQKGAHGKPSKASPIDTPPASAAPAAASPLEKLFGALDAAIHQPVNGAARPDLNALLAREAQLQADLKVNGDPSRISREAAEMLASIYAPPPAAPAPSVDDKPAQPVANPVNLVPIIVIGIVVALVSPLICVVGFWWAGKNSETALRKGLRDAGLL